LLVFDIVKQHEERVSSIDDRQEVFQRQVVDAQGSDSHRLFCVFDENLHSLRELCRVSDPFTVKYFHRQFFRGDRDLVAEVAGHEDLKDHWNDVGDLVHELRWVVDLIERTLEQGENYPLKRPELDERRQKIATV
jgi:hypothetical protein